MQVRIDARYCPWLDRAGRLSWAKLITLLMLFAPGIRLALLWSCGLLSPKPVTEAIHGTGEWAVRFLILSLLITPLRRVAQWSKLIALRRMIGVGAMVYALIHITLYIVSLKFDLIQVVSEIVLRFYLTIGFVALLGLVALGATSTDGMIRRLGGKAWSRLHGLVYAIALLALWHYGLQSKLDVSAPLLLAGLFILLMGQRLLQKYKVGDNPAALAALAVGAGLLTALLEASWYTSRNHLAFDDVLSANLDFDLPLRGAWVVLGFGLALLGVRLARRFWARTPVARQTRLKAAE